MNDTVRSVVEKNLCTSCGACAAVCPTDAICFAEDAAGHVWPETNDDACTRCRLCLKVCPGIHFGKDLCQRLKALRDPFKGNALATMTGQSKDKDLLKNGQSGGVAGGIILRALECKSIDVAVMAVMTTRTGLRGGYVLARNKEDVLNAQQSKYIPIPLLAALKEIGEKNLRFAIVALPCQIHGLYNLIDIIKPLQGLLSFTVGLICDRVMVSSSVDFLIHKAGATSTRTLNFKFRDKVPSGYPGVIHIQSEDQSFILPAKERIAIKDFFTPARCRICFDKMNVFSDITIGDPHGVPSVDRKSGESLIIARTHAGEKILNDFTKNIQLTAVNHEVALNGQSIEMKRQSWLDYAKAWETHSDTWPDYFTFLPAFSDTIPSKLHRKRLHHAFSLRHYSDVQEIIHDCRMDQLYGNFRNHVLSIAGFVKRLFSSGGKSQ